MTVLLRLGGPGEVAGLALPCGFSANEYGVVVDESGSFLNFAINNISFGYMVFLNIKN
ncbi:hypothetical protein [Pseudomonas sp. PH1b]|uniref:hypothetical protein n=1 Tax=Pseudomonas sp. PH1b TaxID=1397282 RepID=UPI0012FEED59|nr:hypothetical protein [Pseudomonas sp. PH1b]